MSIIEEEVSFLVVVVPLRGVEHAQSELLIRRKPSVVTFHQVIVPGPQVMHWSDLLGSTGGTNIVR